MFPSVSSSIFKKSEVYFAPFTKNFTANVNVNQTVIIDKLVNQSETQGKPSSRKTR